MKPSQPRRAAACAALLLTTISVHAETVLQSGPQAIHTLAEAYSATRKVSETVAISEQAVAHTLNIKEQSEKRVAELRNRVRVGRNREADVIAQEVQIESLNSQLEQNERQAAALADLLIFLTKVPNIDPQPPQPPKSETQSL